ncbi:Tryptophan--tRNA ligase, mitochondrial [Geodia barretti]|uniref:tryptophan--tRNA ligase n=1 Tax=Geodia barretti TaxID=519541 RepID=A0AA35RDB9_GEOBA|nr:Tryptophan--tRNA ligase, mitochondrial [Geodia barretti]
MSVGIRRIFSGIQPSGAAHLGNYLGALRQWAKLQSSSDSVLYSIVDLHSLTSLQAPLLLRENILAMVTCLLACGVDPKKSIVFQQSQVSGHAELAWLLGCRTPMGWLNRMTQWKAKAMSDNTNVVGLGLFAYPVLQAADILIYKASHVPVGEDQLQHLELARDIARSFNSAYNTQVFTEPQPLLGLCARSKPSSFPLSRSKLSRLSPYLTPNFLAFPPISLPHTHRRSPASHESKKPSTKDE